MIKNMKPIIKDVKVPGPIFATAITSDPVVLTNYQGVTFLVESGEGTAGNTTLTVQAKLGEDGTPVAVPFLFMQKGDTTFTEVEATGKVISIGGATGASKYFLVRVSDAMLASSGCDRVMLKTTAVASSTVPGAIYALLDSPRYTE